MTGISLSKVDFTNDNEAPAASRHKLHSGLIAERPSSSDILHISKSLIVFLYRPLAKTDAKQDPKVMLPIPALNPKL